jgi:hypothetical protein
MPLWFLSACLWLVLGTPALLWLYRRWPLRTTAVPLISLLATTASVWTLSGRSGEVLLNLMVYAPAWLVGFAHHDNRIRALPRLRVAGIALALMATGLYYALTHQDPESGWDIAGIPLAHSLWGTGVVLLLLRLDGLGSGLAARPRLGRALAVVNARAVTVYLWTNPAITLAAGVLPHPSQGSHQVVPSEQRVVGGTPRPSPVQDRAWGMAPVDGAALSADARRSP